ncbi:LEA type 2 family protein [Archaeoglobus neptunius]|uniref:LEA type 2 family protein n=1 Tax=Archaeoglobus neptunius TaxID=2798580 RepID=UPI001925D936|nr:LEA type 2 family protein [Archaeoglobus neptunius]
MRRLWILLVVLTGGLLPLCAQLTLQKPTVSIDNIKVESVSVTPGKGVTLDLSVRIIVSNPNPFGAHLTKIAYDIYLLNGKESYLGHGEKEDVTIRKQGNTTIEIPTTMNLDTKTFGRILDSLEKQGSIKLKVSGSAYLDLKITTFEVPFEKTEVITPSAFTSILSTPVLTS